MKLRSCLLLTTSLSLLAACGGGSGDTPSSNDDSPKPSGPTVTISQANVEQAATVAITTAFNNMAISTAEIFTGVVTTNDSQQGINITDTEWLMKYVEKATAKSDAFTGVVNTEVDDCLYDGTTSFTLDSQSDNQLSVNDKAVFTFNNCDDGFGVFNGSFSLKFTKLEGFYNLDTFSALGLEIGFDNFSLTINDSAVNFSGEYAILTEKDNYQTETNITSDELAISLADYQQKIQNLISSDEYVYNTGVRSVNISSTVYDQLLGGTLTISTLENFEFNGENAYSPFAGIMKITGADKSSVTLTMLNSNDVQLTTDLDGNGTIDDTRTVNWTDVML